MPTIDVVTCSEKIEKDLLEKMREVGAPKGTQLVETGRFPDEWFIDDADGHDLAIINMELSGISYYSGPLPEWIVKLAAKFEEPGDDVSIHMARP